MKKLVCLPHAGASSSVYMSWIPILKSAGIECVLIDYKGHGRFSNLNFSSSIEEEADFLFSQINESGTSVDSIFGHSMGAILLYELCSRYYGVNGFTPSHLFFSGTPAPYYRKNNQQWHLAPDDELKQHLIEMKGTSKAIFQEKNLSDHFLSIIRNDYNMIEHYSTDIRKEKIPCKSTILYGNEEMFSQEDIMSWDEVLQAPPQKVPMPGNHFYLHETTNKYRLFDVIINNIF